jgi:hypothetical protein
MIDTVDFFFLVAMSVLSPTTKVEYMPVKQTVAMADDAVLGALSLVLVRFLECGVNAAVCILNDAVLF